MGREGGQELHLPRVVRSGGRHKCPILSKRHNCSPVVTNNGPILSMRAPHRYFLTCYTREADDEQVDGLRPRVRRRPGEPPSAERASRITRLPSDPTMMLASLLSAGMLEAGRAVRAPRYALAAPPVLTCLDRTLLDRTPVLTPTGDIRGMLGPSDLRRFARQRPDQVHTRRASRPDLHYARQLLAFDLPLL